MIIKNQNKEGRVQRIKEYERYTFLKNTYKNLKKWNETKIKQEF